MSLSRSELDERGYEGFVSFTDLRSGALSEVPQTAGSYAVLTEGTKPEFIEVSRGGYFKGKDPSVKINALREKWVHGASVVYIGKAENMQRRLREFCRFGAGAAIGPPGRPLPLAGRRERRLARLLEGLRGQRDCSRGRGGVT